MKTRQFKLAIWVVGIVLLGIGGTVGAQESIGEVASMTAPDGTMIDPSRSLILFYSDACSHCHNEMRWLEEVRDDFPDVPFHLFEIEVTENEANQEYFSTVMEAYDSVARAWPRTVIGDRVYIGFVPEDGPLSYNDQYFAWLGYRNLLYRALERAQERAEEGAEERAEERAGA